MSRQLFVHIQFNGDNRSACNLKCPECYGRKGKTYLHYWNGRADLWEQGLERLERDIYGVFSYGEALISKGFYEMVEVFERHPNWTLCVITNFMADPVRLLESKLARDGRLFLICCWHPEGVENVAESWEIFKRHILMARDAGVSVHVMMVWFPPVIKDFPYYFEWLDSHNFRVTVRRLVNDKFLNTVPFVRLLPWVAGTYKLSDYSEAERGYLFASTAPKTIKYGLELANCRGQLCSAGKDMILVKCDGTVTLCAGCVSKRFMLGNLFDENFRLSSEFTRCPINSCGGDFGMLHLVDEEFGSLPVRLWCDTFISQAEGLPHCVPVPYHNRAEMLKWLEVLKLKR